MYRFQGSVGTSAVQDGGQQPQVMSEPLKGGKSEMSCVVSIKYTLEFAGFVQRKSIKYLIPVFY